MDAFVKSAERLRPVLHQQGHEPRHLPAVGSVTVRNLSAERGVLTKINSVLIPGINDVHLIEVNREVKKRGAFLHNIMPLISEPG